MINSWVKANLIEQENIGLKCPILYQDMGFFEVKNSNLS